MLYPSTTNPLTYLQGHHVLFSEQGTLEDVQSPRIQRMTIAYFRTTTAGRYPGTQRIPVHRSRGVEIMRVMPLLQSLGSRTQPPPARARGELQSRSDILEFTATNHSKSE